MLVAAFGAGAHHVTVGQKLAAFLVIGLEGGLDGKLAFVIEAAEKFGGCLMVKLRGGAGIDVKRHSELAERILDDGVVAVDNLLGCHSLLAGSQGDGHSVLVAAAHHHYVLATEAEKTCVNVGRNIHAGKVADVHGTVGIGESGGDKCALEFLFHYFMFINVAKLAKSFRRYKSFISSKETKVSN